MLKVNTRTHSDCRNNTINVTSEVKNLFTKLLALSVGRLHERLRKKGKDQEQIGFQLCRRAANNDDQSDLQKHTHAL